MMRIQSDFWALPLPATLSPIYPTLRQKYVMMHDSNDESEDSGSDDLEAITKKKPTKTQEHGREKNYQDFSGNESPDG